MLTSRAIAGEIRRWRQSGKVRTSGCVLYKTIGYRYVDGRQMKDADKQNGRNFWTLATSKGEATAEFRFRQSTLFPSLSYNRRELRRWLEQMLVYAYTCDTVRSGYVTNITLIVSIRLLPLALYQLGLSFKIFMLACLHSDNILAQSGSLIFKLLGHLWNARIESLVRWKLHT